ncbi:hypothetical protein [Nonomuraea cypriaca]|uniref:hypothetical protein n=1 Tax=Nonomuraea cypriaca TaxID=1187855 RepID=UPI0038B31294
MSVKPQVGGQIEGGEQGGTLVREPGHRLVRPGEARHADARAGRGEGDGLDTPVQVRHGGKCGMDVVVQDAVPRGVPVRVAGLAEFGGVRAQQVVARVLARGVLGEQVGAGQLGQRCPYPRDWDAHQAGGGVDRAAGTGMQPGDQPERPGRRLVREGLVRPGEDRPYVDRHPTAQRGTKRSCF